MWRSTLLVVLLFLSVYVSGQDERSLSAFNEISVTTGIHLTLISGSDAKALITVDGGHPSDIVTEVSSSQVLTIRFTGGTKLKRKASVTLYCSEDINRLKVATAAVIYSSDRISGPHISLEGETGGRINVALDVDELSLDLSSGSIVTLLGSARRLSSEVSSGAALHAFELQTGKIEAECSSGGNMEIFAVNELTAKCSLGGKIVYTGQPLVDKNESSSGTIVPRNSE